MSWKKEQAPLRSKLIRKLSVTRPASFDERVNRLARKRSISAATALHIIAKQEGVSDQRGFQKLTPSEQEAVRNYHPKTTKQTMINSPGASQIAQVDSPRARANTRSARSKFSTKVTVGHRKGWHETWWGAILITVIAGAILLSIQLWVIN